jgi:uncharacterized protein (DUF779 family)
VKKEVMYQGNKPEEMIKAWAAWMNELGTIEDLGDPAHSIIPTYVRVSMFRWWKERRLSLIIDVPDDTGGI